MSTETCPRTEKGYEMEKADGQTESSAPESDVPLIDLTHVLDAERTSPTKSSSKKCRACGWDGTLENFFISEDKLGQNFYYECQPIRAEASRCSSCKVKHLIIKGIDRYEGNGPKSWKPFLLNSINSKRDQYCFQQLSNGWGEQYDLFIPFEASRWHFDDLFKWPRRTIWDDSPEDSIERSVIWARGHITDCLRQHGKCVAPVDFPVTPSRLIDVDPDGKGLHVRPDARGLDVMLQNWTHVPPGNSLKYAALSYCWGNFKPECMTTTLETTDENLRYPNLRRIPWKSLPRTFRDAVIVTRGLGLKYLWIDSICVVQGDKDDWQRESGRMFNVYRGSVVTLAALYGNDSTAGLRNTTIGDQAGLVANLRLGQSIVPVCLRPHHYLWRQDLRTYSSPHTTAVPYLTRAWTYQERIVSPRVLFFTESEVVYQCACEIKCECGSATEGWKYRAAMYCDRTQISQATRSQGHQIAEGAFQRYGDDVYNYRVIQSTWRNIVTTEYSKLNVTNPRDRLVALGAIAEQFQQVRPNSRYLAGMWSDSLLYDLMWVCARSGAPPQESSQKREDHDKTITLPSWSWVSVTSSVKYRSKIFDVTSLAEIVEAKCIYAEDNLFGIMQSSTLVLRGMVLSCVLKNDKKLNVPGNISRGLDFSFESYDNLVCCPDDQEVYLLQLQDELGHISCLILRLEDHNAKIYSRLGIASYWDGSNTHRAFEERGRIAECEIC